MTNAVEIRGLRKSFSDLEVLKGIDLDVAEGEAVVLLGSSGSGKSTLLRCINFMEEPTAGQVRVNGNLIGTELGGRVRYHEADLCKLRTRIGMVFQRPNPFPKSIYENVAFGPRINGMTDDLDEVVETSLRRAAVWDEVKDRLNDSGLSVSGGQQQRICIARALAVNPEIVLMDEPASALDPISTQAIEQLIQELSSEVTIIIVTHNMQQATRISDYAAVMMAGEERIGRMIEYGTNEQVFGNPKDERTEAYVTGRIG